MDEMTYRRTGAKLTGGRADGRITKERREKTNKRTDATDELAYNTWEGMPKKA